MVPTDFDESNIVYDKPEGLTRDECEPLCAYYGPSAFGPVIISCWKCTQEEMDEIIRTGRIWVWHYGSTLQPHAAGGLSPFGENSEKADS